MTRLSRSDNGSWQRSQSCDGGGRGKRDEKERRNIGVVGPQGDLAMTVSHELWRWAAAKVDELRDGGRELHGKLRCGTIQRKGIIERNMQGSVPDEKWRSGGGGSRVEGRDCVSEWKGGMEGRGEGTTWQPCPPAPSSPSALSPPGWLPVRVWAWLCDDRRCSVGALAVSGAVSV